MTMDEKIKRINELYHLSLERSLTKEELKEQKDLRSDYIASVRGNLKAQLDSIKIQDENGNIVDLKKRGK